jgi:hypothetical protein
LLSICFRDLTADSLHKVPIQLKIRDSSAARHRD